MAMPVHVAARAELAVVRQPLVDTGNRCGCCSDDET